MCDAFQIYVASYVLPGETIAVDVAATDTVKTVRAKVAAELGVASEDVVLVFEGVVLDNLAQKVPCTNLVEGSLVEAKPSKKADAIRALQGAGVGWGEADLVSVVSSSMGDSEKASFVELILDASQGLNKPAVNGALCQAATCGHLTTLKTLLAHPHHLEDPTSPLTLASKHGHHDVVQHLLDIGIPPDRESGSGTTPLHVAAESGHRLVVERLLDAGARRDPPDHLDNAPLHLAASNGHASIVKLLLEAGADPNFANNNANTPLHKASFNNHKDVAQHLLDAGGDRKKRNLIGWTPFDHAVELGHDRVAALLEQ